MTGGERWIGVAFIVGAVLMIAATMALEAWERSIEAQRAAKWARVCADLDGLFDFGDDSSEPLEPAPRVMPQWERDVRRAELAAKHGVTFGIGFCNLPGCTLCRPGPTAADILWAHRNGVAW